MKTQMNISNVVTEENPERYGIYYNDDVRGGKWILLLQIDENDNCIVTASKVVKRSASKSNVLYEGELLSFCKENGGYDSSTGTIMPDVAILRYYNNKF